MQYFFKASMLSIYFIILLVVVTTTAENNDKSGTCDHMTYLVENLLCKGIDSSNENGIILYESNESVGTSTKWPWRKTSHSQRMAELIENCCYKPCTITELMSYC